MSSTAPPPQEPGAADKRPCPKCGAQNPVSASFCWQCLSPLAGAAAPAGYTPPPAPVTPIAPPPAGPPVAPPGPPGGPPAPPAAPAAPSPYSAEGNPFRPGASGDAPPVTPPAAAPAAPNPYSKEGNPFRPGASAAESVGLPPGTPTTNELDKRMPLLIGAGTKEPSGLSKALRVIIPVVVGAVAFFVGWRLFGGSSLEIPSEISGVQQLNNTFTEQIEELINEALSTGGIEYRLGVFGSNGVPSFMVLTQQGDTSASPEQNFQNFATVFDEGSQGATIDTGEIQRRDFNGVAYLCAPGDGEIRAVCLWQREDVVGIVAGFDRDLTSTFQITIAAHDAIQGD